MTSKEAEACAAVFGFCVLGYIVICEIVSAIRRFLRS